MLLGLQLVSGLLVIAVILFFVSLWQRSRSPFRGPKGLPLFGHLPTVLRKGLPKTFEEWSRDYGPNYEVQMNKQRWVVFGSLSAIKQVAMSSRYIPKVTFPEEVLDKIFKCKGLGLLLNTDVDRWRIQRKIFVQSLTPSFIEHIGRVAHTEGPLLVSAIKSMRDKNGVCDIHDLVQNLFARTIVPLALGFDRATTEALLSVPYMFEYFRYTPRWLWKTLLRRKTDKYRQLIDGYLAIVEKVVLARKAHLDSGGQPPADFVSHLLRAHKGEVGDSPLSLDEVRHTAIEMFIGATNSTPDMVCYVVLFLAEHTDIQERVAQEILSLPADGTRTTPYLDMVIKETMRHALPSFGSLRQVTEDDVIEGIPLRKGDAVLMVYRELHFNPEYWGPRPHDFQPELHSPEAVEARPAHTYLPFGLGPKGCPGSQLAMTMMRVVLLHLLRAFRFKSYNGLTFKTMKKTFQVAIKPGEPTNVMCIPRE